MYQISGSIHFQSDIRPLVTFSDNPYQLHPYGKEPHLSFSVCLCVQRIDFLMLWPCMLSTYYVTVSMLFEYLCTRLS